jgi:NADPH:quinone reductase
MPDVEPSAGEVRVAVAVSALSPGDVKKRSGWQSSPMPYPRVIPHSDGAGVIDRVGDGVSQERVGEPVWCYGAQSYRPFGTAAEFVTVPSDTAVRLPDLGSDAANRDLAEQAACLGIAGITGYRAVFADGPVAGLVVLVHGAAGGVGSIATQMAVRAGATVIAVVRPAQKQRARELGATHAFASDQPELSAAIRAVAPHGVNRIAEVDLADHADLDAEVIAIGAAICSYYSPSTGRPFPTGSSDSPTPPFGCSEATTSRLRSRRTRRESSPRRSPRGTCDR